MSITLALEDHVPAAAIRGARRWLYAGDDPGFALAGLEGVPAADAKMAAAHGLREAYLDAIGALSRLNASPEWWATHLAAKHPYPSLFARVCGVAAARELASDGTLVVCSTPAQLRELVTALGGARGAGTGLGRARRQLGPAALRVAWPVLRGLGHRAPAGLGAALAAVHPGTRFALERTPGYRRRTLSAAGARRLAGLDGAGTVLLVTWLDERCFGANGEYRDPHLGPLDALLGERDRRVARLVKPLLHAPFARCARALLASGAAAALTDAYLGESDWRACERRVRSFDPEIPPEIRVGTIPFAALAREYHREHLRAQVDALTHEPLVQRMAETGVRPELIIFPWEGHAWEQVLTDAVRRYLPDTEVVGYDNLNFSSLALSLYPSESELDLRPLPDRVVTNGTTFADVLRASPFPTERVRPGCALRHTHLSNSVGVGSAADERGFVLAACSIDTGQSVELLRKASAAFGDQLMARLHPASDARAIRAALPATIRYASEPLTELLPRACMMLYTYSVVPYEALAAGTPPVFVRSESMLDLDQLEPTPDVRWVARTPAELREVAAEIEALPDRDGWERRAREVVRAALRPVEAACVEQFLV